MTGVQRSPPPGKTQTKQHTTPNTRLKDRATMMELNTARVQMKRRLQTRLRRVTRTLAREGEQQASEWINSLDTHRPRCKKCAACEKARLGGCRVCIGCTTR